VTQVSEYVKERVLSLRREHPSQYGNISCLRTNAQKYLVHYFHKGQLQKLFFLFPVRKQAIAISFKSNIIAGALVGIFTAKMSELTGPRSSCEQDPHFKASTHRRRIISRAQLADYAYLLAPGGMLYTITDVPELGAWIREKVMHMHIHTVMDLQHGDYRS
jgi:tRNA (guanine-N7-)-methyltransferase